METNRVVASVLFADIKGFSKLSEHQLGVFATDVLGGIAEILKTYKPVVTNTWGDGFFVVFNDPLDAAKAALSIRDFFLNTDWQQHHLPTNLSVRIGIHAATVHPMVDPLTSRQTMVGSQLNLAARIEAMAMPGQVWASDLFAELLAATGDNKIKSEFIGKFSMKQNNEMNLYRILYV